MRFMVMIKATPDTEAGVMPSNELLLAMGKYNEELVKAGVMLDGNGLAGSASGARLEITNGKTTVIDGPFAETRELIAGYWIWECKSLEEAIEWLRRCPASSGKDRYEIRRMFELSDFEQGAGIDQHLKVAAELASRPANS
jgi:hypothetical protein